MSLVSRWKHGGVEYPLSTETDEALLKVADPAVYYAIELFRSVIGTYVGPALLARAAVEGFNFPSAVEKTIHSEPTPYLLAEQFVFPLFALWRSEEAWAEVNKSFSSDLSTWEWAYVLPPMSPLQIEKLHPILRSVSVTVATFAQQSFDPSFEEGRTLRDLAGIQKMSAGAVRYGNFEPVDGAPGQWWRAVSGKLLVKERDEIVLEAFPRFDGANIAIDETSPDGTKVEDFVLIETPPAPEILEIAPASGSKAGGQPLQVTGRGFLPGREPPRVLVGGAYASSVVVLHPTLLQCLTPEHEAYPTFAADVLVINPDGQESNVLSGAYTFTSP